MFPMDKYRTKGYFILMSFHVQQFILMKFFYNQLLLGGKVSNSSSTLGKVGKSRATPNCRTLISLFFGDKKFLWIINQIFYCGFKNRRSFRKQTFIWDYILRVQCELKHAMSSSFSESERLSVKDFVTLIDQIGDRASTYGKDMKFQLFILIALRYVIIFSFSLGKLS